MRQRATSAAVHRLSTSVVDWWMVRFHPRPSSWISPLRAGSGGAMICLARRGHGNRILGDDINGAGGKDRGAIPGRCQTRRGCDGVAAGCDCIKAGHDELAKRDEDGVPLGTLFARLSRRRVSARGRDTVAAPVRRDRHPGVDTPPGRPAFWPVTSHVGGAPRSRLPNTAYVCESISSRSVSGSAAGVAHR